MCKYADVQMEFTVYPHSLSFSYIFDTCIFEREAPASLSFIYTFAYLHIRTFSYLCALCVN